MALLYANSAFVVNVVLAAAHEPVGENVGEQYANDKHC
jgi:hypothetical protein